jgi:hypothetical protein
VSGSISGNRRGKGRHVLAVEAFEGTNAAITRGGELGRKDAVMIKVSKPKQDFRFDVPWLSTHHRRCAPGKIRVIAVEAGKNFTPRTRAHHDGRRGKKDIALRTELMTQTKIRAGVVGTGSIGRNHARILAELPSCEFTAIYDTNEATARETASKYGAKPCTSLEEFIANVDAATVATPTPSHFPIGTVLLEAGKHLLVEKPITENTADARALAQLASVRRLVLQSVILNDSTPCLSARATTEKAALHRGLALSPYPGRSTEIGVVLDS